MRDPWLGWSLAVLSGGMLGVFCPDENKRWTLLILLLSLSFLIALFRQKRDFFGQVYRPRVMLAFVSIFVGYLAGWTGLAGLPEPVVADRAELTGLVKDWQIEQDKAVGILRLDDIQTTAESADSSDLAEKTRGGQYRLTVYPNAQGSLPAMWLKAQPGDWVHFTARLEQPKSSGTPGGLDLRVYYSARGLRGSVTAQGDPQFIASGKPPFSWLIRQQTHRLLSFGNPEEAGIMEGILFGDNSGISPMIQEIYQTTGVLHVFAASGSNVAFVLALSWMLFFWIPFKPRIAACIVMILFYAVLCGGSAPIMRATILAAITLLGRLGRGRTASLRWLVFAALYLFAMNPVILRDTGFQLSFAAAWGISEMAPRLVRFRRWSRVPLPIRNVCAVTLAAQAATLPILIVVFHRVSLIGLAVNVGILFILGGVFELGLLGVMFSFWPDFAQLFFQAGIWLLQGTNVILERLAVLPWADFWIMRPGSGFVFWWYGLLAIFLFGHKKAKFILLVAARRIWRGLNEWRKILGLGGKRSYGEDVNQKFRLFWETKRLRWGVIALLALLLWHPWRLNKELEIAFLDVGQGDSMLIRTPEGHAVLLDTGPRTEHFDAGERILIPYLMNEGINHIDVLLLTHEHSDHLGGAPSILRNLPVDWIGVPAVGEKLTNEEWRAGFPKSLAGEENQDSVYDKLCELQAGDRIELDSGAWMEVLAPSVVLSGTRSDQNNNSLILRLHYGSQRILFGADMEKEEMAEIADSGQDWEADFLKQPHHGSKYSLNETWLNAMHPQAVFISVGKNSFGHPAQEVLDYWRERQVPVYRTDEAGTIRLYLEENQAFLDTGRAFR